MRLAEQAEEALHHVAARLAPRDGPELGGADGEHASHQATRRPSRARRRITTMLPRSRMTLMFPLEIVA
jgi:hypothetical protein